MVRSKKKRKRRRPIGYLDVCLLQGDVELFEKVKSFIKEYDICFKTNLLKVFVALYDVNKEHTNQEIMDAYGISRNALNDFIERINDYALIKHNSKNT